MKNKNVTQELMTYMQGHPICVVLLFLVTFWDLGDSFLCTADISTSFPSPVPMWCHLFPSSAPSFSINVTSYLHQAVSHATTWGKVLKIYCELNHNPAQEYGSVLKI